jgi:phosphoglycerate dehydrogenase-like enzyme
MGTRILSTAELPAAAIELLSAAGDVAITSGDLPAEIADADVLVVRAEHVGGDLIEQAPRLRVIARTGSGVDNVDVATATRLGIPVVNAPLAGGGPVAEGTWALILAGAKRIGQLRACIEEDRWHERYRLEALDLRESTLGVVGLGSIGRQVARVGHAFGMHILGYDAMLPADAQFDFPLERTTLESLVRRADVITLHCDLNPSTRGMIDRDLLRTAERSPVFVNAARGPIVSSDELLLEALDAGWLSAVALDVFAAEPLDPGSPLLADPRVVCTPHSIGLTRRWNHDVFSSLARDIRSALAGERPVHLVNPAVR